VTSPHVQQSTELLAILPSMAHGATCVVFTCIGLFEADPLGASKRDICDYTALSRQTVETALRFLEKSELVEYSPDTKCYRAKRFYRFGASEKVEIRELVPILQGECAVNESVKNFSPSRRRISTDSISDFISSSNTEALKTLRDAGVMVDRLSISGMTDERASTIAAYIRRNPDKKTSAAAWVYVCLQRDAEWMPSRQAQVETVGETMARMRVEGLIE